MSRLDSFIRRMSAQRDILNALATRLPPGAIYEFGLGSGRTYDHLCELFPDRRIVVFENDVCPRVPRPAHFMVGDLRETTAAFSDESAALIHADIETGSASVDAHLVEWLPALMARLLVRSGFAVSGSPLLDPRLCACPLPAGVAHDRYHMAQKS